MMTNIARDLYCFEQFNAGAAYAFTCFTAIVGASRASLSEEKKAAPAAFEATAPQQEVKALNYGVAIPLLGVSAAGS